MISHTDKLEWFGHKPLSQGRRQHRVLLIFTLDLKTQMLDTNFFFQ